MKRKILTLATSAAMAVTLAVTMASPASARWRDRTMNAGDILYCSTSPLGSCAEYGYWAWTSLLRAERVRPSSLSGTKLQIRLTPGYNSSKTCWAPGGFALGYPSLRGAEDSYMTMQSDGNLVWYSNGRAIWSSRTNGNPGARLDVQEDGNVVIYTKSNRAIWATNTANRCKA